MQDFFTQYKPLLFKLAYQLTGSVADAEDAVQDVFVKAYGVPPERWGDPKAYLCKMVTNRCKDMLKSAKRKREQYVGEWLPEPFLTSEDDGIAAVERDDLLSYGMLVLLERLTASERVVFVLREALGFEYREIAEMMDKGEANCRKLFSRASAKLAPLTEGEAIRQPQAGSEQWIEQFLSALKQGNMERLLTVLDREVVCVSDGGGKAQVAPRPIATSDRVARFLLGATRKTWTFHGEVAAELASMNGQPAVLFRSADGAVDTVGLFHVEEGAIRKVYFVRNPDKLKHVD